MAVVNGPNGVYGNVSFSQNGCGESVFIEVSIVGLSPGEHVSKHPMRSIYFKIFYVFLYSIYRVFIFMKKVTYQMDV